MKADRLFPGTMVGVQQSNVKRLRRDKWLRRLGVRVGELATKTG